MRELQKKLRDLGYDQQLTGRFADRTEANVKAFQRSRNMAAVGYVGPRTRDALLGGSRQPDIPAATYSADACTSRQCSVYLSRATAREYATLLADHPLAATAVSTAVLRSACTGAFKVNFAAIVCYVFMDHYATRVKTALAAASRQRACLRITLTRPDISTTPLTFATDNSGRCT